MRDRNVLPMLITELRKHKIEVELPVEGLVVGYLIETYLEKSLLEDFIDAYGSDFEVLARKILGDEKSPQVYGLILTEQDNKMFYTFAFNRKLAYFDAASKKIVHNDPQDVLAAEIDKAKSEIKVNKPVVKPLIGGPFDGGDLNMMLRYSLPDPGPNDPNLAIKSD